MAILNQENLRLVGSFLPRTATGIAAGAVLALVATGFCWIFSKYARVLKLRRNLPPGPFPLPLVGNFFQVSTVRPWLQYEYWAKKYDNPMTTLWNGNRPMIVCNDAWTISDLLEKKATIYSSRPHMVMLGDMRLATDADQVCLPYGDHWRLHRRLTHTVVGSQAVRNHRLFQGDETKILLNDLLERPSDFASSIERYSCSLVSIIGWGRRIDKSNDYVAQMALKFMEGVDYVLPGIYIMEAIPILSKLPPWLYSLPAKMMKNSHSLQKYFYALSQEATGAEEDNFAKTLLREQEKSGLKDGEVASLTANLIGGGVDTTSSTTLSFILAMCVFQDVQKKAQEEIDRVVGQDRMPDWIDEFSLPYVSALISETLRWRTVTILGGIPHAPIEDDTYRGYFIPKHTWIVGNLWAIHRNPREFPDPDVFRPDRFLNSERPYPNKKGHNAFGWGRRQCSGQPLAEQGLFLTVARMLWCFNLQPGLDEYGNEVKLDIFAFTDSENMRPEAFKARFSPRNEKIAAMIAVEAAQARKQLHKYDGDSKLTVETVMKGQH